MLDYKEIHYNDYIIRVNHIHSYKHTYTLITKNGDIITIASRDKFLLMLRKDYDIKDNALENIIASY